MFQHLIFLWMFPLLYKTIRRFALQHRMEIRFLFVRQNATSFITLLLIGPHELCEGNDMIQTGSLIRCSCHGSTFTHSDEVSKGPAQSNLTVHPTTYDPTTQK